MFDSVLIIANPTAGGGRGSRMAEAVAAQLRSCGTEVSLRYTAASGEAEAMAAEAGVSEDKRPSCVVACGGDGTIQEVANALAPLQADRPETCPALGLAPAGRCNDFARALGIAADPAEVAQTLTKGQARAVDLGRVNDRYFCTVATVGIDSEVSSYVDSMRMPLKGTAAYLYGALCVLARYQPRRLKIHGDFDPIDRPVFLASSANTSSYGGAIPIAPAASPFDGMLDLCVIDPVSRLRSLTLIPTVLRGRHQSCPEVRFIQAKRLEIEAEHPVEVWADGERIAQTPVTIEIAPAAVRIVLPNRH